MEDFIYELLFWSFHVIETVIFIPKELQNSEGLTNSSRLLWLLRMNDKIISILFWKKKKMVRLFYTFHQSHVPAGTPIALSL